VGEGGGSGVSCKGIPATWSSSVGDELVGMYNFSGLFFFPTIFRTKFHGDVVSFSHKLQE